MEIIPNNKSGGTVKNLLALILLLSVPALYAQSFRIGPGGGATIILSPEELTTNLEDGGFGLGTNFHYGAKVKLSFPLVPIRLAGQIYYTSFSSEASLATSKVEYTSSMLTLGAGCELSLIPGPISPYGALDLLYTSNGESNLKTTIGSITDEDKVSGESRYGVGLGIGLEVTLLPMLDIDASVKYQMNNLIGKEDGEENFNTLNISVNLLFELL